MKRRAVTLCFVLASAGCGGTAIDPGHRGVVVDPMEAGRRDVLAPGYYHLASSARVLDYDVTYSTRREPIHAITVEGLSADVTIAVIYRPIIAELYELNAEIGPNYYDEVIGPEFRSAAREELAKHSYTELTRMSEKLEDAIEVEVRRRISGKHVELSSLTIEAVTLPPEILDAVRRREIAQQEALREKAELERAAVREKLEADEKWQKEKLELEHDVERRRLRREAEGAPPQNR